MAYGDILEINGQLVEHTPIGYIPVSAERAEGMLTKPAPTTKTTTPTQTLPTGTPTTDPNKAPAGETGGFDPNAGTTTSSFRDEIPPGDEPSPSIPGDDNDGGVLVDGVRVTTGEVFEMLTAIIVGTQGVPEGTPAEVLAQLEGREYDSQAQLDAAVRQIVNESFDKAQEIVDTMVDNPEALEGMEDPGALTKVFIEQGGLQFAGAAATTPTTTVGGREVIRGGAGVTVNVQDIVKSGNYQDVLDAIVPYIPGVSLPNWMPTAGVIFLPTVGEAINKVNEIAGSIGDEIEDGESLGEILSGIGQVIVGAGGDLVDEIFGEEGILTEVLGQITGAITDPTKAGTIIGGVLSGSFPSGIPDWLGGILIENVSSAVYGSVRNVLVESGTATEDQLPLTQEVDTEVDPTLMFTNRGNNYFVSSEGDEYFQLAESEDLDFELNGQYTREQLENTGLETIGSGTYQSLLDDLSFHALEEDIYEYSLEDLRTRYEEEGGIIPGDWKEMDDESKYNFLLDDYFEIPPLIEDPDKGEGPTEPEPTPTPTPEPEPTPTPEPADDSVFSEEQESVIRDLFADIIGEASLATTADITAGVAEALTNAGIIDAEGNVIRADVQQSVIAALTEAGIVDENGDFVQQVLPDVQAEVTTVLTNAGIIDTEGNIIRPDMQSEISTALTNAGIIDADGNVIRADMQSEVLLALQNAGMVDSEGNVIVQEMPDVQSSVTAALTAAGIVDEEGNVIRQEAPDIEGGVVSALQTLGLVNAEGELTIDLTEDFLTVLQNAGIVDEEGNVIPQEAVDVEGGVLSALQSLGIVDTEGQVNLDVSDSVLLSLQNAGIVDSDGNVIEQDVSDQFLTTLQNVGLVDEEGNVIRPDAPDIEGGVVAALQTIGLVNEEGELTLDVSGDVLTTLQNTGIVDSEGNVIRQEAPDIEGGVLSALQTVGLVDEQGQLTLDVTGDVLLALQNAGVVDADGNVVQQDITNQFLTTLQSVGLVDEEGNVIRQELPDIPAAVISALQTVGLVDNNGNLTTDVSGDVLLTLQNSGIVDEQGNVIRQDISGELLTTLQNAGIVDSEGNVVREELPNFQTELGLALQTAGIVDEEGLSLLATSEDLSSLRDQLVNAGLIGENVTVASQADLDSLITALTDSGLLGEETLFATTSNINDLRDDLTTAGLIGENADVATSSDIASLRGELVAVGLLGDDAIQLASAEDFINELGDYQFTDAQIEQISNAINIPENLSEEQIKQLFTDANLSTSTNVSDAVTSITNAIDALDIPNLEDIKTALSEYGFSEAQLDQIAGAIDIPANLSGEDITQLFTDAGLSTATNVSDAVTTITNAISNLDIDKTVRTALSEFNFTEDQLDQISGAIDIPPNLSGEEVTQLFANAELATATNVTDAVSAINTSLGELGFATPDDVKDILSNYEFTDSQIEQIVGAIPAGLSLTDVDTVVDNALVGVATGENLTDATTTITNAISGLSFATDTDVRTALSEFNFTENQLNQISALMPDTLTGNELTLALNASLENTPTNADLTTVYDNLVTNLTTGFSAITGEDGVLERQDALLSAISGEGGVLEGQQDILTGQEGLLTSQQQIRELVGEETQTLQDMFVGGVGGLLGAMAAGQTPAAPAPREFTPFKETFEYAPTTVETLQAKPQVDYNKEVNRLLTMGMGGRKSGMLV